MSSIFFTIKKDDKELYYNDSLSFYLGVKILLYYSNSLKGKNYQIDILKTISIDKENESSTAVYDFNIDKFISHGSYIDDLYTIEKKKFKFLNLEDRKFLKYIWLNLDLGDLKFSNVSDSEIIENIEIFKKAILENTVQYNITDGFDVLFLFIDKNDEKIDYNELLRGMKEVMNIFGFEML
jgi:hypothetical protein